jgi:hypothetical protein
MRPPSSKERKMDWSWAQVVEQSRCFASAKLQVQKCHKTQKYSFIDFLDIFHWADYPFQGEAILR